MMINLLPGILLTGSTGDEGFYRHSSSSGVGKTSLANYCQEKMGLVRLSLGDDLRDIVYNTYVPGNGGEDYSISHTKLLLETPKQKNSLIYTGEAFNEQEPYGWAIMVVVRALHMMFGDKKEIYLPIPRQKIQGFIIDDVRSVSQYLLLSGMGFSPVEVIRPSKEEVKGYSSDGRLTGLSPHYVTNTGDINEFLKQSHLALSYLIQARQEDYQWWELPVYEEDLPRCLRTLYFACSKGLQISIDEAWEDDGIEVWGEVIPSSLVVLKALRVIHSELKREAFEINKTFNFFFNND